MNMKVLNYISKINNAAKYCSNQKQIAYNNENYELCDFYKNEQNKLYLLKALWLLYLNDICIIKKLKQQKDENGTILESFSSEDRLYYYHLISRNQDTSDDNIGIYTKPDNSNSKFVIYYQPYVRYLKNMLPDKYKLIYEFISSHYFYFCLEEELMFFCENGIKGHIEKSWIDYYDDKNYLCNLYINDVQICNIKITTCFDFEYLSDKSGILVLENEFVDLCS